MPEQSRPPGRGPRPSHATVVAWLALFVALGGVASGLPGRSTVDSGDVVDNSLRSADLRDGGVRARDIAVGTIGTSRLLDGAVTPAKVGGTHAVRVETPQEDPGCAQQELPSDNGETARWSVEDYDTSGMHAAPPAGCTAGTQSRLTAPIDGLYLASAGLAWGANDAGRRQLEIVRNGSQAVAGDYRLAVAGAGTVQTITTIVNLNAGDYVEIQALQNSGDPLTLTDSTETHFSLAWVGAPPE